MSASIYTEKLVEPDDKMWLMIWQQPKMQQRFSAVCKNWLMPSVKFRKSYTLRNYDYKRNK